MVKVFTSPNSIIVANIQNVLALKGVSSEIRNEFALGAVGELSCVDVWPEVWVESWNEEKALRVINEIDEDPLAGEWCCCSCREQNEASFECCWKCGTDRSDW